MGVKVATLIFVLFGLSQAVNFTIVGQDAWELQPWFNNEPYNHAPGAGQGKNLFTVGDGLFSYEYNETHTLLSYFDTTYGQINVSDPAKPHRQGPGIAFSHSSYATVPMSDGVPSGPQTNTPGGWIAPMSIPNSEWLWSGGGFVYDGKLYTIQHHCYVKNGGEWCDTGYIVIITDPFVDPQKWKSETKFTLPLTWDHLFKDNTYVYLRGQTKSAVRLGRYTLQDFVDKKFDRLQCWNIPGKWEGNCTSEAKFQTIFTLPWLANLMNTHWNNYLQKWVTIQATICSLQLWSSDNVTGPWTSTKTFWEISKPFDNWVYCYQAASHPSFVPSAKAEGMFFTTNSMAGSAGAPDTKVDPANGHRRYIMSPFPVEATLKRGDDVSARSRATSLGPIRYGVDIAGSDIAGSPVKAVSAFECQKKCQDVSECVSFAFDNSGQQRCWLKNNADIKPVKHMYRTYGILNRLATKVKLQLSDSNGKNIVVDAKGVLTASTSPASVFLGITQPDGTFFLQFGDKYVQQPPMSSMVATSSNMGSWETFWLEKQGNGLFTIYSNIKDRYVQVTKDNVLLAGAGQATSDTFFKLKVL